MILCKKVNKLDEGMRRDFNYIRKINENLSELIIKYRLINKVKFYLNLQRRLESRLWKTQRKKRLNGS